MQDRSCAGAKTPNLGWIAARAPNRVNRAHGPTKENRQKFCIFPIFPAHAKNGPRGPQMGPGGFFPTNPDLADILGRTDFDLENIYFLDFLGPHLGPDLGPAWAQLGPSLGPAWAQAWAQTPPTALAPPDEFSDPNLTPLPTHPGIKYVARALAATVFAQLWKDSSTWLLNAFTDSI